MRALLLAAVLATAPAPAAADDWTKTDTTMQLAVTAAIAIDWMQTASFRARDLPELNPILGPYPGRDRVNLLIGGAMLGSAAVALFLPQPYRLAWQVAILVIETGFIIHNARLGTSLRIPF